MAKSEWQKCPVCNGMGNVLYPPGTAGSSWSGTSVGPWPCARCNGSGTIVRPAESEEQLINLNVTQVPSKRVK